jgi:hypothetical protein
MKFGKFVTLLVIAALMASSLALVNAVSVDDLPKPSAPEFTVKIVSYPYDVPAKTTTSTTIDQYTGKETTTTTTIPGYHVENKSIELRIKNPNFAPITTSDNQTAYLYYKIMVKGHFGNSWVTPTFITQQDIDGTVIAQLGSAYTIVLIKPDFPDQAKIDLEIESRIGYFAPNYRMFLITGYDFYGVFSDFSSIQTLTIGAVGSTAVPDTSTPKPTQTTSPQPTQSPTVPLQTDLPTTPTQPAEEQSSAMFFFENTSVIAFGVSCILIGTVLVVLAVYRKRGSA